MSNYKPSFLNYEVTYPYLDLSDDLGNLCWWKKAQAVYDNK